MASEVTPDAVRRAQFRTTLRGLDRTEVESMLEAVAMRLEELEAERLKLKGQLEERPGGDLEAEFENLGREITAILQAARDAAESMREKASLDSTRWRTEAIAEAESMRKEAAADAEALRRDAWVTGSELLEQSAAGAEAMRAAAERDVLTIMGEAEREAHRLTSGARREAEDLVRNANMDAEQITSEATGRRDEIIDGANRQAAAAQERARALEQRRDELLDELENVRSTLTRLEGSLEERREALTSPEPSNVKVVHPPADAKKQWELGETVRVVPTEGRETPHPDAGIAEEMSDQVARIQHTEPPVAEPEPEPPRAEPEPEEGGAQSQPEPEEPERVEPKTVADDLSALFASLRGGGGTATPSAAGVEEPRSDEDEDKDAASAGVDWITERESRLLPITNRALRGVKKAMTEVQNVALDSLRTEEEWHPDEGAIAKAVHAELLAVWAESFAAGHAVAEQMTGDKLRRPSTPSSKADTQFASDLASAVNGALETAGDGSRERQSAASRVFRVWRSDEAERRIRDIALRGYEAGIEKSRKVTAG
ncbi:MAG: DivIVA domain-containing protein [Acidimicrobiia bacterium]